MGSTVALPPRRIVVVEDNDVLREMIHAVLEDTGYDVTSFADGREALRDMRCHRPPDLIVLDLWMAGMNGWEFRVAQKRDPDLAETPVVLISGETGPQVEALDAAVLLVKPFSDKSLVSAVDRVFASAAAERARRREAAQEARLASLGTLAAGIAHEVNNPLASLVVNLAALRRALPAELGEDLKQIVADCDDAANRIRCIVRDVSSFARPEEADVVAADQIERILSSSLRLVSHQIRHRAALVKDFAATPPVLGHDGRLGQLFINLLVNAGQAIPEGHADSHTICVRTRTSDAGECVIEVADTGVGIPADVLPRLFEPFFTTKPTGQGTGLGLSISHAIVTSLGGRIEAESRIGHGSTFRVFLPAAPTDAARFRTKPRSSPPVAARRVLVVDDEAMLVRALVRALSPPHEVTVATSGVEALDLLMADDRFDLIVCDLLMPRMTGIELYAKLATERPGLERRVVFMTGSALMGLQQRFAASVTNRILQKPFDMAELRSLLER